MGAYSAPAFALGYYKAINDVATVDGTILIDPVRCADWMAISRGSPLFDGDTGIQVQLTDDTWYDLAHFTLSLDQTQIIGPQALALGAVNALIKYPYNVRLYCITHPTAGVGTVWLITEPRPANPLF